MAAGRFQRRHAAAAARDRGGVRGRGAEVVPAAGLAGERALGRPSRIRQARPRAERRVARSSRCADASPRVSPAPRSFRAGSPAARNAGCGPSTACGAARGRRRPARRSGFRAAPQVRRRGRRGGANRTVTGSAPAPSPSAIASAAMPAPPAVRGRPRLADCRSRRRGPPAHRGADRLLRRRSSKAMPGREVRRCRPRLRQAQALRAARCRRLAGLRRRRLGPRPQPEARSVRPWRRSRSGRAGQSLQRVPLRRLPRCRALSLPGRRGPLRPIVDAGNRLAAPTALRRPLAGPGGLDLSAGERRRRRESPLERLRMLGGGVPLGRRLRQDVERPLRRSAAA